MASWSGWPGPSGGAPRACSSSARLSCGLGPRRATTSSSTQETWNRSTTRPSPCSSRRRSGCGAPADGSSSAASRSRSSAPPTASTRCRCSPHRANGRSEPRCRWVDGGHTTSHRFLPMRAIRIERFGGPEVLELAEVPDPTPTDGMLLLDVNSVGVNYADTHQAENSYLSATQLPFVPGTEIVGRDADGRRLLALVGNGGYAERAVAVPALAFELPDGVADGQALALLVQGLTAW